MGNHQTNCPKRLHRPSECVGFNKQDTDDDHLVTILQRERRVKCIHFISMYLPLFCYNRFQQKVHHHLMNSIYQHVQMIRHPLLFLYLFYHLMHMQVLLVHLQIGLSIK